MAQSQIEAVWAIVWKVTKGQYGPWLRLTMAGAIVALTVLGAALALPQLRIVAWFVSLAFLIGAAVITVALLARTAGQLLDVAANVSLQSQLDRIGFTANDFFVDGAAASPSLQLILVKILSMCSPRNALELGSGQTTRVLAHYARSEPTVRVLTIEENSDWHHRLSMSLNAPDNHLYVHRALEAKDVRLPNNRGIVATSWYSGADHLLAGQQFDLILMDGPTNYRRGDEFVRYSRSGIIPYLPSILAESFAIIIDDTDNFGYSQTARSIQEVMSASGRFVNAFELHGVKSQTVLCSRDWQFLRSV
jgi:hypothetical protein